jgi:elongation factor 1-gamma
MSASGTLYTYPENFRAYKALIAAQYSGAQVKVDPNFQFGVTNKTDAFLAKFPLGKVPAFESTKGELIFDSNAIAYAVANEQLRGKTPLDQALVLQWISFAEVELLPASCTWVFPCLGLMPFNKGSNERAKEDVKKFLSLLNSHLLTRTYLVGERISLADISVTCTLLQLYQHVLEPSFRAPYQNVNRWFTTMINQPQVQAVIGNFELCSKMLVFDNKKFAEVQGKLKSGDGSAKKEKKQEKEKKPAKEAKEPKASEEAAAPPEPKPKDPLDALPAGNFNMDDFKRFYSNNDEEKSVPYFWEKFDKENYSIWFCEYKYPEELTKIFMTCNLVGGMFQRLDKLRKNGFASMCVFGVDGDNSISGVWVWRGHELAFPLSEDWQIDYESYDWRKLDSGTDETKKLVDQYFKWNGEDSKGRKFNQGKIFK